MKKTTSFLILGFMLGLFMSGCGGGTSDLGIPVNTTSSTSNPQPNFAPNNNSNRAPVAEAGMDQSVRRKGTVSLAPRASEWNI